LGAERSERRTGGVSTELPGERPVKDRRGLWRHPELAGGVALFGAGDRTDGGTLARVPGAVGKFRHAPGDGGLVVGCRLGGGAGGGGDRDDPPPACRGTGPPG